MSRINIKRYSSSRVSQFLSPYNLSRWCITKVGSVWMIGSFMDRPYLQSLPVRIDIGQVHCISMTQTGRIQSGAVMVDSTCTVNNFIFAVTINVADA